MKWYLCAFLFIVGIGSIAVADDKDVDSPFITTMLEQRDGTRISLRFKALAWDDVTMDAMQEVEEIRTYYNENVFNQMGILNTNVQLQLGPNLLDPGSYYIGVLRKKAPPSENAPTAANDPLVNEVPGQQGGAQQQTAGTANEHYFFTVADSANPLIQIPIPMRTLEEMTPYLSFVFQPGITSKDFVLMYLYGNEVTSLKWTIKGVPSIDAVRLDAESPMEEPSRSSAGDRMLPDSANYDMTAPLPSITGDDTIPQRPVDSTVQAATATNAPLNPTSKPRGLGAFRRLFDSAEDLRGKLNQ